MRKIGLLAVSILLIAVLLNTNVGSYVSAQSNQTFEITEIGQLNTSGWAANIHVQENTAFVADSEGGLYIVDISDPENPTELSQFNEGIDHLHELYVDENLAYVADYTDGFKIINVSDSENPTQVGRFHDGGEVGTFDI
ncbi:MAG: LVIVD repeat-containing protein, partial [Candidatus Thorarchaeota archaeon]